MNAINNDEFEINDLEMETKTNGSDSDSDSDSVSEYEYVMMKFYWPIFTVFIVLIIWAFFIWGIWCLDKSSINMSVNHISPPLESFPFITVNEWPSCTSARGNSWRLVTYQLTHAGLSHIVFNTIGIIFYGTILECLHPKSWFIIPLVFEMACIFGCLGHSYIFPFYGVIGCSAGIYGLIGACISFVIIHRDILSDCVYYSIVITLFTQGTCDMVAYFYLYNPRVSYAGHCSGFFIGVFLGLSFGLLKNQLWKKVIGALGVAAFLTMTISLIEHYMESWPPQSLSYNPTFHEYNRRTCCGELYSVVNSTFSLEQARGIYECDYNTIYIK